MSFIIYDLEQLYRSTFGTKPKIGKIDGDTSDKGGNYSVENNNSKSGVDEQYVINVNKKSVTTTKGGSVLLTEDLKGVEIWLPTWLEELPAEIGNNGRMFLPYSVIRITGSSSIIRTPLAERRGTVKELYSIDDYKITLKGFFIDKEQRVFPEKDLIALKKLHEEGRNFRLNNALANIFLADDDRCIMSSFELPEVSGGRTHVRPFVINLESDSVFTLEVSDV